MLHDGPMLIDGLAQSFPVTRRADLGATVVLPGKHLQHIQSIDAKFQSEKRGPGMLQPASEAVPAACICRHSPDEATQAGPSSFSDKVCCIKYTCPSWISMACPLKADCCALQESGGLSSTKLLTL